MARSFLVFALFLAGVSFSYWISLRSWGGAVYVYVGEQRAPASLRTFDDYSSIDRRALSRAVHEQLMAGAQLTSGEDMIGVRFGHPLLSRDEGGGKDFACDAGGRPGRYDRIEITFYGSGVTDSGEPPFLVVDADCVANVQADALDTFWIPLGEILADGARDKELKFTSEDRIYVYRLEHIPDVWPEDWSLWSVRFFSSESEVEELVVDAKHLKEAQITPVAFQWKRRR